MKRILILTIFILVFCFEAFGQLSEVCPKLKVEGPEKITAGDLTTITASLEGNQDIKNILLKWGVVKNDSEVIVKEEYQPNKNSKTVTFDSEGASSLKVIVEMFEGVSINCKAKIEMNITIHPPLANPRMPICSYDEYFEIIFEREKARLDNYAIELQNKPDVLGYFQFFVTEERRLNRIKTRITKIIKHFEKRGIAKNRIAFSVFASKYENTKFWLVPAGVDLPDCNNCKLINIGKI